jgi:hypothetical protein
MRLDTVHILQASADNATGMVTCQTGDIISGEVFDPAAPVMQQWGLLSLPDVPVPGVSAPEAQVRETGHGHIVLAGRSVKTGAIAGMIQQGETCVFADGSQASTLYKLDGSIIDFTTHDNTAAGRSVFSRTFPGGWETVNPWGRARIDKTGFHAQHASGSRIDFGSVSGLPSPIDALASYMSLQAATVRINGSLVSIGPDVGLRGSVLRATGVRGATDFDAFMATTSAALGNISAALADIANVITAMGVTLFAIPPATVPNPAGTAALATALAAVTTTAGVALPQIAATAAAIATAVTAINAAKATMPSNSTTST